MLTYLGREEQLSHGHPILLCAPGVWVDAIDVNTKYVQKDAWVFVSIALDSITKVAAFASARFSLSTDEGSR